MAVTETVAGLSLLGLGKYSDYGFRYEKLAYYSRTSLTSLPESQSAFILQETYC